MEGKRNGSLLVEVAVATGILALGIVILSYGFIQARRISLRNRQTAIAIDVLKSQVDKDSKVAFDNLSDTNPAIDPITVLANAALTRTIIASTNPPIKTITYTLSWDGSAGSNTIRANYQLTQAGLANE